MGPICACAAMGRPLAICCTALWRRASANCCDCRCEFGWACSPSRHCPVLSKGRHGRPMPVRQRQVRNRTKLPSIVPRKARQTPFHSAEDSNRSKSRALRGFGFVIQQRFATASRRRITCSNGLTNSFPTSYRIRVRSIFRRQVSLLFRGPPHVRLARSPPVRYGRPSAPA